MKRKQQFFRIYFIIIVLFFLTQFLGLLVINSYQTHVIPYGISPPVEATPQYNLFSIVFAIFLGIIIILFLMKFKAEVFLRLWFFVVVILALAVTFNGLINILNLPIKNAAIIVLIVALPLAYIKIFVRNIKIHNLTEIGIYPGVATLFVPLLNIWTAVGLLFLLSLYDMYAVWHAGFMQKMAKYQINNIKVFPGFLIPALGKKSLDKLRKSKSLKSVNKVRINVAMLGGGDVVFPMILAGVVLVKFGLLYGLIISLGATIALSSLIIVSLRRKPSPYPAMPFILLGCLVALAVVYLIRYIL